MKRFFKLTYGLATASVLAACSSSSLPYWQTRDGMICRVGEDTLALSVQANNIIKVSVRKNGHGDTVRQMSFVDPPVGLPDFKIKRCKNGIVLSAGLLQAVVRNNGNIDFREGRRKRLTTALWPEAPLEQSFTTGREAIMGLGQFQNGVIDLRGLPLRLQQYNQEIANPFMVSSAGYGLLWANTSVTDYNYPDHSIEHWETVDATRNEKRARFVPKKTGVYKFFVESVNAENRAGGPVLLTFDGDTVLHYNTIWVPDCHSGEMELQAGREYEVRFTNSHFQGPQPARVMYNEPDRATTTFRSRYGNGTDYYVVAGSPREAIAGYRRLTGKAPLFGKWALGFWQCRERYRDQQELLDNAAEYRKRGIPVDNIVQDWSYWPDGTWGPEWDRKRYPSPREMCRELDDKHFHLMVSVWPWTDNRKLEEAYGLTPYKIDQTNNLDFFHPDLRKRYYRMLNDSMFALGVNSIWLDGTEPEHFPKGNTYYGDIAHNALAYSYGVTRSVYEGRRADSDLRVFNLTRSGFAGQQRFAAAVWSGDVNASWEQFAEQITAGLNLAMSGLPYWTTDIGGFFRDSHSLNGLYDNQYTNDGYKELLTRWLQFGTFCPLFRIHGYGSQTEVWRYGQTFEDMARHFIELRYRLMPYIYSEAAKVTTADALLMRPLMHDYPNDMQGAAVKDEFLFGDALLVCPVIKNGARSREVYLPEGKWTDFWQGGVYDGGKTLQAEAPLHRLPLYVKCGSILPVGAAVQYASEPLTDPLKLIVYPGADGSFVLYEDDGQTYGYERGQSSTIRLEWNDAKRTLHIGARQGRFEGMDETRPFEIVIADKELQGAVQQTVVYRGEPIAVHCGR